METQTLDWRKHERRKYQVIGVFFGLAGLGLITAASINYLLLFIGIGLIAYGIYLFVDDMNLGGK